MVNKKFWLGILVMALVFGMTVVGCNTDDNGNGGGGNTDPKTLVINNIPSSVYNEIFHYGTNAGLSMYNVGTTPQQMASMVGFAAGVYLNNSDINRINIEGNYMVTIPLYKADNSRWTGNGIYDVILIPNINSGMSGTTYKASSVNFSTEITTVSYNSFQIFSQ